MHRPSPALASAIPPARLTQAIASRAQGSSTSISRTSAAAPSGIAARAKASVAGLAARRGRARSPASGHQARRQASPCAGNRQSAPDRRSPPAPSSGHREANLAAMFGHVDDGVLRGFRPGSAVVGRAMKGRGAAVSGKARPTPSRWSSTAPCPGARPATALARSIAAPPPRPRTTPAPLLRAAARAASSSGRSGSFGQAKAVTATPAACRSWISQPARAASRPCTTKALRLNPAARPAAFAASPRPEKDAGRQQKLERSGHRVRRQWSRQPHAASARISQRGPRLPCPKQIAGQAPSLRQTRPGPGKPRRASRPARRHPRAVVSRTFGRSTGAPMMSDRNCIAKSLAVMPPSTRRMPSVAPGQSARIASRRSRVW
jgi:hypothetical protein